MSIGPAEIIIVLILALLVFGPKRLPQMGRSLGKGVREFRKAADTAKQEFGLSEVTDGIKEVKDTIAEPFKDVKETVTEPFKDVKDTVTEPLKDVRETVGDLRQAVNVKSAIEAPVGAAAAAGAAGAAVASTEAASTEAAEGTAAASTEAAEDDGPAPPAAGWAFIDDGAPQAPEAPAAPEPVADAQEPTTTGV